MPTSGHRASTAEALALRVKMLVRHQPVVAARPRAPQSRAAAVQRLSEAG
jgi:hypothetical protein